MAVKLITVARVGVVATAVVLFATGHSVGEAAPSATTPGLAKAATPTVAAASSAITTAGFTLTSVSVEFPVSDRMFPAGPGVEVVQANCAACHSAGMVLNQPILTRSAWEAEVNKMLAVYKAPVAAEDVPAIVDYLAGMTVSK